ncbi:hypothetical protein CBX57_017360 [Salmonella enterica]|nr:hypothetical protein [Salmonella enterica]
MVILTPPLSASEVQKAKPGATEYELFDGQGLTLFVSASDRTLHAALLLKGIDPNNWNRKK